MCLYFAVIVTIYDGRRRGTGGGGRAFYVVKTRFGVEGGGARARSRLKKCWLWRVMLDF